MEPYDFDLCYITATIVQSDRQLAYDLGWNFNSAEISSILAGHMVCVFVWCGLIS